ERGMVWHALGGMAGQPGTGYFFENTTNKGIALGHHGLRPGTCGGQYSGDCSGKSSDSCQSFRSRASAIFLAAAVQERLKGYIVPNQHRPCPPCPTKLM